MPSRAIKPKREPAAPSASWQGFGERRPSIVRDDTPQLPRIVALISLMLATVGGASLLWRRVFDRPYLIPPGLGFFLLTLGIAGLLYHAFYEKEFQFRRVYGFLAGFGLFGLACVLRFWPANRVVGGVFLPYGGLCLIVSLGFLLCFIRNETDIGLNKLATMVLGFSALANALAGFIGGMMNETFLLQTGILHLVFGLLFAVAFVGAKGESSTEGLWASRGIGLIGAALLIISLGRSVLPYVLFRLGWGEGARVVWFLPSGLILCYLGIEYLIIYLGIASDSKLVVLTRRELGSFFCSPIAYIALIAMAACGCLNFYMQLDNIFEASEGNPLRGGGGGLPEPIVPFFFVSFIALIPLMFIVPIITMRALSEEKRTGTLEMLLTTPVNEWQVVFSKFLACLRIFMLCWYTWAVYFIALRVEGGQEFDYRPVITFLLGLVCMGAGFVAMGLFFSSVTSHQILAAVCSFVVMLTLTILFILMQRTSELNNFATVIRYISFVDLWISSASGTITPRLLMLNLAIAVMWLFLTIKVLEARKWS